MTSTRKTFDPILLVPPPSAGVLLPAPVSGAALPGNCAGRRDHHRPPQLVGPAAGMEGLGGSGATAPGWLTGSGRGMPARASPSACSRQRRQWFSPLPIRAGSGNYPFLAIRSKRSGGTASLDCVGSRSFSATFLGGGDQHLCPAAGLAGRSPGDAVPLHPACDLSMPLGFRSARPRLKSPGLGGVPRRAGWGADSHTLAPMGQGHFVTPPYGQADFVLKDATWNTTGMCAGSRP